MKTIRLWAVLVSLLLTATAGPGIAGKETAAVEGIDLKLTRALVEQWATRKSFPESVTFAYYHVYMAGALGMEIDPETRGLITAYIADCQQPDGGFTPKPLHTTTSSIIFTYYGLAALDLLGESKAIDARAATGFIRKRIQPDGGIVASARENDRANLATTYYGIEALRLLGAVDSGNKKNVTAFVERYREKGRGFTRVEGGASTPQSTYMGLRTLQILGAMTDKVSTEVIGYLKGTRYSGLITDRKYALLPGTEAMAATLEALAALSAVQQVNTDRIHAFVDSLYVSENGGFGPRPGLGTTPPSTYHAIQCLVRLGKLPDPMTRKPPPRPPAGN